MITRLCFFFLVLWLSPTTAATTAATTTATPESVPSTIEHYAVIVSSSRYWFNYRHTINALTMYRLLKDRGKFTDDRIILMLADEDYATNARNPYKNYLTSSSSSSSRSSVTMNDFSQTLYDAQTEIDYRGQDVTVENLARVLSGRSSTTHWTAQFYPPDDMPVIPAATTTTTANDNDNAPTTMIHLFLYLTGHGGDGFFKFQDVEEILATDLAALLHQRQDLARVLLVADTCQAFTLGEHLRSTNEDNDNEDDDAKIIMVGSSLRDESSYAHHSNADLGLAMIERYTHAVDQFMRQPSPAKTPYNNVFDTPLWAALKAPYSYDSQRAHIGMQPARMENDTSITLADFWVNPSPSSLSAIPKPWSSSKTLWNHVQQDRQTKDNDGSCRDKISPLSFPPPCRTAKRQQSRRDLKRFVDDALKEEEEEEEDSFGSMKFLMFGSCLAVVVARTLSLVERKTLV